MSYKKNKLLRYYRVSSTIPSFTEPTPPSNEILLQLNFYELSSMFQERSVFSGGVPVTPVVNNTDPVGTIFDQSLATMICRATGATTIPTLTATGIKGDGVNDLMEVVGSTAYMKFLHSVAATRSWGICCWVSRGADGTARTPFNNQGLAAAQSGGYCQFTAANQTRFFLGDGTAPAICDVTHTGTFTVADGLVPLFIDCIGDVLRIRIKGVTQTFACTAAQGSANNASQNLRFFGDGSTFFAGTLAKTFKIINRPFTNQEITDFEAFNPAVTAVDFTPVKQWWLDFNDTNYVFSDLAETIPITNGGTIRSVKSKVPLPNVSSAIPRRGTTASDPASPLWRLANVNGKSSAEFNGSGTQIITYSEDLWIECGGVSTTFFIFKNNNATFGFHYINGNPEYGTCTGNAYSGNLGATGDAAQPYSILHHGGAGGSGVGPQTLTSRSNGWNIICIRRKGGVCDIFNQAKQKNTLAGFGKFTSSLFGLAAPAGGGLWDPNGFNGETEKYMGFLSDAQVNSKIDYLAYLYGVSVVL